MSFDIIIFKPTNPTIDDISAVEDVIPLGATDIVSKVFNHAFPGCIERAFISGNDFSVELMLSGEPVESAHLTLQFGQSWADKSERNFQVLLAEACRALGGVAFAVSDNSRIAP